MPIKGLTQVRRLPRLGKIKMGIKVKTALESSILKRLIILSFPLNSLMFTAINPKR